MHNTVTIFRNIKFCFQTNFCQLFEEGLGLLELKTLPCHHGNGGPQMDESSGSSRKCRKLNDFKKDLPHCSQSALSAILDQVRKEGLPEKSSTKDFRQASEELLNDMDWHGPLWQTAEAHTLDGKTISLQFVNVLSLLAGLYNADGCFTHYLDKVFAKTPSSLEEPWPACLYSDEVHPGHQLSSSSKKCWVIYLSFLPFGKDLSKEDLWLPIFICRSSVVQTLASSIGQVFKLILENLFGNGYANPLSGVRLKKKDGTHLLLHFCLGMFLQDGSAQKFTFSNRQDGGSRICMLCKNIFISKAFKTSGDMDDEEMGVLAQFIKVADLDLTSDEELLASWQRMKARQADCNKTQFKKWMQAAGLDFTEHALPLSQPLQGLIFPCKQYCHDYMHCLCSKGALSYITAWVLEACWAGGMKDIWSTLESYLQLWVPPAVLQTFKPHKLFEPKSVENHRSSKYFKCSASEMLSLYRPLGYFLQSCCIENGFMEKECKCFLAWCAVLDFCVAIPMVASPSPQRLQALVEKALESIVECQWGLYMRPKMHWPLHWPQQLEAFKLLPSCWSLERKHKSVRRAGGVVFNMATYDHTVLREVLCEQVAALTSEEDSWWQDACCLLKPTKPSKKMQGFLGQHGFGIADGPVLQSRACKLCTGWTATVGDFVYVKREALHPYKFRCGEVKLFLQCGKDLVAFLEEYSILSQMKARQAVKWKCAGNLAMVLVETLEIPVVYHKDPNGEVITLTPAHVSASS